MWAFPMAAALVSAIFSGLIAQQWLSRNRNQDLAWAIALLMFAIASFAAGIGILGGWSPLLFRAYYLFGAIVNVPVLAAGTLYLLSPRPIAHLYAVLVVVAVIFAAGTVFSAHLNETALSVSGIPSGSQVMAAEALPRVLSRYYSFTGFFIVVGGALWSAWRMARRREERPRALARGNVLIAAGTFIVAVGSGFARYGQGSIFAVSLLIGVSLMFMGFIATRTGPSQSSQEQQEKA